jgi:aquaporin Z
MSRLTTHWREYLFEAFCLGLFLVSAAMFATLLQHPDSPVSPLIASPPIGRGLMGLAMGATAAVLIYSPFGRRSGAHMNPAVTLTFLRLGRITGVDAAAYVAAQFVGGLAGIVVATALLGERIADPSVNYVATEPGAWGPMAAFAGEAIVAFVMMTTILTLSNLPRLARYTGIAASVLIAASIAVESPVSGMSINPARTLGSNLFAGDLASLWIYFIAPPLGMLLAAEFHTRRSGAPVVRCAKLHHPLDVPCIFRCGHPSAPTEIA